MLKSGAKRTLSILIFLSAFIAVPWGPAWPETTIPAKSEQAVALVNGSPIVRERLMKEFLQARIRLAGMGRYLSDSEADALMKGILEKLIHEELLFQESTRRGLVPDKGDVERELAKFRDVFSNDDEYQKALTSLHKTEDELRRDYSRRFCLRNIIDHLFWNSIQVSEAEILAAYEAKKATLFKPETIHLRRIFISVKADASEKEKSAAREKALQVKRLIDAKGDFAALAKGFSDGPEADKGGDLGIIKGEERDIPFKDRIAMLKAGDVSEIMESEEGFQIFKVEEKSAAHRATLEEVQSDLKQVCMREKVNRKLNDFVLELKEKATIERFLDKP